MRKTIKAEKPIYKTRDVTRLLPLVYHDLRRLAGNFLKGERTDHTLQPTALVHEAYMKLTNQKAVEWQNKNHVVGLAAQAMRRILVDHARSHNTTKRGGELKRLPQTEIFSLAVEPNFDFVAVDEALAKLEAMDPVQAKIVELKFFGGLTIEEVARVVDLSPRKVRREWSSAKAWLNREISKN